MGSNPFFQNNRALLCGALLLLLSGKNYADTQVSWEKLGGEGTVYKTDHNAFSMPMLNMPMMERLNFSVGNSFFRNPWVIAPSSTAARDGLGPLFNTNACQNCHIKDGRGHAPESLKDNAVSLLLRLSMPAKTDQERARLVTDGVIPEPVYGGQLQDFAVPEVNAEGRVVIEYDIVEVSFADGDIVRLRKPILSIKNLAYGEMHGEVMMSARIAPPMIGLGLLEAVPEQQLLAWQDPDDKNSDGISGRVNRVWNKQLNKTAVGRFGWKAGQPTLKQQNAAAFNGDLGITSTLFTVENCSDRQQQVCLEKYSGGEPELADNLLDQVTFYTRNLAVPARRGGNNQQVAEGYQYFKQANCQGCHREQLRTGESDLPWLANQTIYPFTDLLLHDMGEGLADHRPEFLADGREWRTPPLWGIGLTEAVTGQQSYLHDGRARSLMEAILWHGGEAEAARQQVLQMKKNQREALITFLESL